MTPADRLAVLAAAVLVGALYVQYGPSGEAHTALVHGAEQGPQRVNLQRDAHLNVQGALGTSAIEVEKGRIRFVDSPCTGKVCVHSGWLSRGGEVAACLPNGISIEVARLGHGFDAINF